MTVNELPEISLSIPFVQQVFTEHFFQLSTILTIMVTAMNNIQTNSPLRPRQSILHFADRVNFNGHKHYTFKT